MMEEIEMDVNGNNVMEGKVRERPFHYLRKKVEAELPLKTVIKRYKKELKEEYKIIKKETRKKKNKSFQRFVGKKHDMNEIMRDVQLGYQGIQFKGEESEKNLEKSTLRYAANPTLFIQKCIRPIPQNEMGGFRIHFPSTEEVIKYQNQLLANSKNNSSSTSTSNCNDLLPVSELNASRANQDVCIAEGGESESTKWITNISITAGIKDDSVVSSDDDIIHISTHESGTTTKKKYNKTKSQSKGVPKRARASTSNSNIGRPVGRAPSKPRKDANDEEIQLLKAPKNWVGYYY